MNSLNDESEISSSAEEGKEKMTIHDAHRRFLFSDPLERMHRDTIEVGKLYRNAFLYVIYGTMFLGIAWGLTGFFILSYFESAPTHTGESILLYVSLSFVVLWSVAVFIFNLLVRFREAIIEM